MSTPSSALHAPSKANNKTISCRWVKGLMPLSSVPHSFTAFIHCRLLLGLNCCFLLSLGDHILRWFRGARIGARRFQTRHAAQEKTQLPEKDPYKFSKLYFSTSNVPSRVTNILAFFQVQDDQQWFFNTKTLGGATHYSRTFGKIHSRVLRKQLLSMESFSFVNMVTKSWQRHPDPKLWPTTKLSYVY